MSIALAAQTQCQRFAIRANNARLSESSLTHIVFKWNSLSTIKAHFFSSSLLCFLHRVFTVYNFDSKQKQIVHKYRIIDRRARNNWDTQE